MPKTPVLFPIKEADPSCSIWRSSLVPSFIFASSGKSIWLVAVISPVTSIPAPKSTFPAISMWPSLLTWNLVTELLVSLILKLPLIFPI